jgi:hypothetical protein
MIMPNVLPVIFFVEKQSGDAACRWQRLIATHPLPKPPNTGRSQNYRLQSAVVFARTPRFTKQIRDRIY